MATSPAPSVIEIDGVASPGAVLRALAGEPGLICFWGDGWGSDGGASAVITSRPAEVSATPDRLGGTGAPWFGWLGYDRPHRLARHDHLLRYADGGWRIEMWPTPAREAELTAARAPLPFGAANRGSNPSG